MTLFVVSPHLDDAVLSVGAAIAARTAAGEDVVVVSVCSVVDVEARVAEDIAAVAILGARHLHLGLQDAPLRGIIEDWRGLCGDDVDEAAVAAFAAAIAVRLAPLLPTGAEVWGPLAVGDHVDHRATAAALTLLGHDVAYEERPYSRRAGAVQAAWERRGAAITTAARLDVDDTVAFLDRIGAPAIAATSMPTAVQWREQRFLRDRIAVGVPARAVRDRALRAYGSQWPFVVGDVDAGGWPWDDEAEALWRPA